MSGNKNKLKVVYDTGFQWAERSEQADISKKEKYKCLTEAVRSFQEAISMEDEAKHIQLLNDKVREFNEDIQALETELKKLVHADNLVQAAMRHDQNNSLEKAEQLYLEAAEKYLGALKGEELLMIQKKTWEARINKVLNRVDEIKQHRQSKLRDEQNDSLVTSLADSYSKEELEVLKNSSWINGHLFVPWAEEDARHESFVSSKPFKDPDGLLSLSEKQNMHFHSWKRASQLLGEKPRMIVQVAPENIHQDVVADCSFVSSLCIAAHHERRFRKQLITNIIYPQNQEGKPIYNPSGKYIVKLWYNGTARRVVVDDRFPVAHDNSWLCSYSRKRNELWVSIIEKAYMKLNGGFDFPGSVSGIDLYALTGWIPEVHHLTGKDGLAATPKEKESTWKKLLSATDHGDVLMTVATGFMDDAQAERLGLVPTHAYAVLCVCEVEGKRLLQLKNPWSKISWRGNFSAFDTFNWTPELRRALQYDLALARKEDNGIFWIDYDSLLESFHSLYLNWNPKLFEKSLIVHRAWPEHMGPKDDTFMVGHNPQFHLNLCNSDPSEQKGIVWILLSRHVTDKNQLLANDKGLFLGMNIYNDSKRPGMRVYYPSSPPPMIRAVYSNNPHCLVAFQVEPGTHDYVIMVSLYEKTRHVNYSLVVYSSNHFIKSQATRKGNAQIGPILDEIMPTLPHTKEISGEWVHQKDTAKTFSAGGCPRFPTFMNNPQWKITFTNPCRRLHMRLLAPKDYAINIRVYRSNGNGRRIDFPDPKLEVGSSGQYRKGFCVLELDDLSPEATYILVVSTFIPNQHGPFVLELEATSSFETALLDQEGEGMLGQVIRDAWTKTNGVGCPNYGKYHLNPAYILNVDYPNTEVAARLQYDPPQNLLEENGNVSWPSLNLSIFKGISIPTDGTALQQALATSNDGVYVNPPSGVRIPTTLLEEPGQYVLVPSTFQPMQNLLLQQDNPISGDFKIYLHSSAPVYYEKSSDISANKPTLHDVGKDKHARTYL